MRPHHLAHRRATLRALTFSLLIALLTVGMLAAAGIAAASEEQPARGDGVGRALAEFGAGVTPAEAQAVAASCQATLVREVPRWGVGDGTTLYAVASESLGSRALAAALEQQFPVTRAAPDGLVEGDLIPNDPDRQKQWALNQIWAYSAWSVTLGDPSVVVAVLDAGVNVTHPDLAANVWTNAAESAGETGVDDDGNGHVDDIYGIDGLNGDTDPNPETDHGIHVAGIGWSTQVMNLKCLGGEDNIGTSAAALACIAYVLDQKADNDVNVVAINTSFGGGVYNNEFIEEAIDDAEQAGIVWVASAGNDGVDLDGAIRYPATYDSPALLTVGATILYDLAQYPEDEGRATDDLALWSNYGDTVVDLGAPGRAIYSTHDGDEYGWLQGTSQAAPYVAGAVALCAAEHPDETALERVDRVLTGVDQIASLDGLVASGGRLNLFGALSATADEMKPTAAIEGVDSAWHTGSVVATFTGDDGTGIGVDRTEYKLDDGVWTPGAGVTVATDGAHTLQARSVDKAGRVGDAESAAVKVDKTAPTAQAAGADDAWHTSPVELTLTASDATSGLDTLEYRLGDGGAWTAVTSGAKVAVSAEGETTVQYRASDVAGNSTGTRQVVVRIDTVKPTASAAGADDAWHTAAVQVTLTGSDAGSGVAAVQYRLTGSSSWTDVASGAKLAVSDDGVHEYQYRAVDAAGNASDVQSFTVKVDTTAPTIPVAGPAAWRNKPVELTLTALDATSGLDVLEYRLGTSGAWTALASGAKVTVSTEGTTTVQYRASDVAGNVTGTQEQVVRIDSKAPVAKGLTSTAKRRAKANLRYVVKDAAPSSGTATVSKIVIRNRKGKVLRTYRPNAKVTVNKTLTYRWKCTLAKGKYTFVVYAKDVAGNTAFRPDRGARGRRAAARAPPPQKPPEPTRPARRSGCGRR
jgi:subtilisin family serine protease